MKQKPLKNIKITIAYDGTNYSGWQLQKNDKTIQGMIEKAITKLTKNQNIKINGSGRTDSGVHAIGQVANFKTHSDIPLDKWPIALNQQLPGDIRIKQAKLVDDQFHARFSAKSKIYYYYINNKINERNFSARRIFLRNYCYFFPCLLDIERMKLAARYLIGEHDFTALSCTNNPKKDNLNISNRIRRIEKIDITKKNNMICFSIEANSFLYKMVRIIVGTLIDISIQGYNPEKIKEILSQKNNQMSGNVVPSQGLYLIKVRY